MILKYCITVFVTQLIFIGFRTWNVKAVSKGDLKGTLISGAVVHLSWLVSIALGADSTIKILRDFQFEYIPVIAFSLAGGLLGSWIGLMEKRKK
jgi:hypothetical protein